MIGHLVIKDFFGCMKIFITLGKDQVSIIKNNYLKRPYS